MTTTPTTIYPPLPELSPRAAGEAAEQYGLRALLFVAAERLTVTVDTEGLQLAAHTFRLAVSNPALTTAGAERLADVGRMISGALARREDETQPPAETAQAPAGAANGDRPNLGPMAPLAPAPKPQGPPSAARGRKPAPPPAPFPLTTVQTAHLARMAAPVAVEDLF